MRLAASGLRQMSGPHGMLLRGLGIRQPPPAALLHRSPVALRAERHRRIAPFLIPGCPTLPFKLNQERRHHISKPKHKVTNSAAYDASLRQRGSLTSTGLKLFGSGEWLIEKHGTKPRRSWRKLHISMEAETGQIVAAALTAKEVDDGSPVGPLLDQVAASVASFTGDSA